jgi:TolB-like protein/Tfp pilus assembly protein PilF
MGGANTPMEGRRPPAAPSPDTPPAALGEGRLDSWKEIAAHLRRAVRTVKRWEKEEGLPVHRHQHIRLGTVYAYTSELDAWWASRARLHSADPERAEAVENASTRRWPRLVVAVAVVVAMTAAAYSWWSRAPEAAPPKDRVMLAVLPFADLSSDKGRELFNDGLTDDLITGLGRLQPDQLGVIARTSSMLYRDAKKSAAVIASELGVDYLVEGSVRHDAGRVRVAIRLIRARDQSQMWAETYDQPRTGLAGMQLEVLRAIGARLPLDLDVNRPALRTTGRPPHPDAYEATLRGRYLLERRTAADLRKAVEAFEQAIALQPDYAIAHVGLADAYILSATYADVPASEAMAMARREVQTALMLDERLPEAHAWLGIILSEHDWDWAGAEQRFRRAIDLDPNFAYGHKVYAEYLSYVGRFDTAIAEARLARQMDPVSIVTSSLVGIVLYRARRYEQAIVALNQAIAMHPDHAMPYLPLGLAYSMKGMHGEAVAALEKSLSLAPDSSESLAQLAHAYGRAGQVEKARAALEPLLARSRTQHVSPFSVALVHLATGDATTALDWLERAYRERDWYLCLLKIEPILDSLRQDRRFQDLVRRLDFPE